MLPRRTRLRIWGSGVRIPSTAPSLSASRPLFSVPCVRSNPVPKQGRPSRRLWPKADPPSRSCRTHPAEPSMGGFVALHRQESDMAGTNGPTSLGGTPETPKVAYRPATRLRPTPSEKGPGPRSRRRTRRLGIGTRTADRAPRRAAAVHHRPVAAPPPWSGPGIAPRVATDRHRRPTMAGGSRNPATRAPSVCLAAGLSSRRSSEPQVFRENRCSAMGSGGGGLPCPAWRGQDGPASLRTATGRKPCHARAGVRPSTHRPGRVTAVDIPAAPSLSQACRVQEPRAVARHSQSEPAATPAGIGPDAALSRMYWKRRGPFRAPAAPPSRRRSCLDSRPGRMSR